MMAEKPKKLDAADMKRIEDYYVNSVKGFYDEKNKKTTDFGAIQTQRKTKKAEEKEAGLGLQIRTDERGEPLVTTMVGVAEDFQGATNQFTLPKKISVGIKGENRMITDLYLTEHGEIGYQETVYTGKISGEKVDPADILSGAVKSGEVTTKRSGPKGGADQLELSELNNIARGLGYRNAGELQDALEGAKSSYETDRASKKKKKTTTTKVDTSKYN